MLSQMRSSQSHSGISAPRPLKIVPVYAREDRPYLEELSKFLMPLIRRGTVELNDDRHTPYFAFYEPHLINCIREAQVVIMLISVDFANSEFIYTKELPEILHRAEGGGLKVLPVVVRPYCLQLDEILSGRSTVNIPGRSLAEMSDHERERFWCDLAAIIASLVNSPEPPEPSPPCGIALDQYSVSHRAPEEHVYDRVDGQAFAPKAFELSLPGKRFSSRTHMSESIELLLFGDRGSAHLIVIASDETVSQHQLTRLQIPLNRFRHLRAKQTSSLSKKRTTLTLYCTTCCISGIYGDCNCEINGVLRNRGIDNWSRRHQLRIEIEGSTEVFDSCDWRLVTHPIRRYRTFISLDSVVELASIQIQAEEPETLESMSRHRQFEGDLELQHYRDTSVVRRTLGIGYSILDKKNRISDDLDCWNRRN